MTIIIDMAEIHSERELNNLIYEELKLYKFMGTDKETGKKVYGFNFSAFWDVFSYTDELININIINSKSILSVDKIEFFGRFLSLLDDLKTTNPNFDYKILS